MLTSQFFNFTISQPVVSGVFLYILVLMEAIMPEQNNTKAILVLADGTVFEGRSFSAEGETIGEVVFNTSMTGYQEIITDSSYKGQIVASVNSKMYKKTPETTI